MALKLSVLKWSPKPCWALASKPLKSLRVTRLMTPATASDPCPEMLNEVEVHTYMGGHIADVHAAGCIHASPAVVWQAIQDAKAKSETKRAEVA